MEWKRRRGGGGRKGEKEGSREGGTGVGEREWEKASRGTRASATGQAEPWPAGTPPPALYTVSVSTMTVSVPDRSSSVIAMRSL